MMRCKMGAVASSDMGVLLYTDFGFVKNGNFMQFDLKQGFHPQG